LSPQPGQSSDAPLNLSSTATAAIAPIIKQAVSAPLKHATSFQSSATVTAALTARLSALQQENEELYGFLKSSTTAKMHEEVRALRRVVQKLEGALKGSFSLRSLATQSFE